MIRSLPSRPGADAPPCLLPRRKARKGAARRRRPQERLPAGRGGLRHILVVDDDPGIQVIVRFTLEAAGMTVGVAHSGREGIEKASASRPDLILLDVMMPGLDGLDTLRILRETPELAGIPVIFLTAKARPEDIAIYASAGVQHVVAKPFDPLALPDRLRDIWDSFGDARG